jgi:hypothetical protein
MPGKAGRIGGGDAEMRAGAECEAGVAMLLAVAAFAERVPRNSAALQAVVQHNLREAHAICCRSE